MSLDLAPSYFREVTEILERHVPKIPVWAFGSRVEGRAKKFSDLDLALAAGRPIPKETVWDLRDAFTESNLPFRVDIIDLASVSKEFQSIVIQSHQLLQ